jgi:putative peptide zinc metalloprotease protein
MFIMLAIALFVATEYPVVGIVLAIWSLTLMLALPLIRQVRFLIASPVLHKRRGHAFGVIAAILLGLGGIMLLVPLPYATVSEGIVWAPDESAIYAGADGVVTQIMTDPAKQVVTGEALIQLKDPLLDAQVKVLDARKRQLTIRHEALEADNLLEAKIVAEKLHHTEAELALARKKHDALLIRSSTEGQLILPHYSDLEGTFVQKGEILGYVAKLDDPVIRVIVTEAQADLVRNRVNRIDLRFVDQMSDVIPAIMVRDVPALSDTLPSMALSLMGGGEIAIDPTRPEQARALAKLLHLELKPLRAVSVPAMGGRVYVRFDHGVAPVAWRIYRAVRQVFLKRLSV